MADDRKLDPRMLHSDHATVTAEASTAAHTWQPLVEPGMYVVGVAGDEIGQVKEVRASDFLIDRAGSCGMAPSTPIYLSFERIHAMLSDRITLDIPGSEVDKYASLPSSFSP